MILLDHGWTFLEGQNAPTVCANHKNHKEIPQIKNYKENNVLLLIDVLTVLSAGGDAMFLIFDIIPY